MSSKLSQIHALLYRKYRPWMMDAYSEARFKELLSRMKTVKPEQDELFDIEFLKPLSFKRKFYKQLIDSDLSRFLNKIHFSVSGSKSDNQKKYHVYTALSKTIKDYLKATQKVLEERELSIELLEPKNGKIKKGDNVDEAYIFHYLKHQLIKTYLEISEAYPNHRKSESLELEDLYLTFFDEVAPEPPVIIPILDKPEKSKEQHEVQPQPQAPVERFRYIHFDTEPENLTDLCDSLRKNGFIDEQTTAHQFKKLFSGQNVTDPVIWTGNPSELYYLISQLYNKHGLLGDLRQKQWKVACESFVKPDGSLFDPKSIRVLKRPASTGDLIDKAVNLLL